MNAQAKDIAFLRSALASQSFSDPASQTFTSTSNLESVVMLERISTGC
jgi:hypothetical protein